ncbi:MAG: DedA family protein [Alphaproteobacteria bacterium]|nr:DedA family protein [Alphaproteobacteria bacterium]MBV9693997.1 DedA family protein [Alphaproteobacteria bacterium]
MSSAAAVERPGPLRRLYNWVLRNARGPRAWAVMGAIAFAESSFFPFPPDLLLAPMLLANRKRAFALGAWCSFWSVLGGMLGYAIGHLLQPAAWWLIDFYHMQADAHRFIAGFRHNIWLIALQGLTPIPYKIVTISAGIAGVNFWWFTAFSAITRSVRFVGEATLFYLLGERAQLLLEKYLTPILIVFFVLIVGGFVALHYLF